MPLTDSLFPNFPKVPRHPNSPPTVALPLPGSSWCSTPTPPPRLSGSSLDLQIEPDKTKLPVSLPRTRVDGGRAAVRCERCGREQSPDERGGGASCEPGAAEQQGGARSSALVSRTVEMEQEGPSPTPRARAHPVHSPRS